MKLYYDVNGYSAPISRFGTNQNLTVGAASVAIANAFAAATKVIRVCSTTAAHISLAPSPIAIATDQIVPANEPLLIVLPASGLKLAALQQAAGGTLSVTEML